MKAIRHLALLSVLALWALPALAVDFAAQVRPLLESRCQGCHNEKRPLGGVRVDTAEALAESGAVVSGEPDKSRLYTALLPDDPKLMPPGRALPEQERAIIREWIAEGAEWSAEPVAAQPMEPDERELVAAFRERAAAEAAPDGAYVDKLPGTELTFEMKPVPAGAFTMGSPATQADRNPDEGPQREVSVDGFWMSSTEITWDIYRLFMIAELHPDPEADDEDDLVDAVTRPTRPYVEMSFGMGLDGFPAISMTQHAAAKFTQWLSAKTGHYYRLPTEAEWEYACRAGTTTAYSFGDDPAEIDDYGWYWDNSAAKYQKVGVKKPNPWGLHDMHGNVMEWTLDGYDENGYPPGDSSNPLAKPMALYPRTARGGSWNDDPDKLRCAARVGSNADWKMQDPQLPKSIWYLTDAQGLGIRIVRPAAVPSAERMFERWNSGLGKE